MERLFTYLRLACLALTIVVAAWVALFFKATAASNMIHQEEVRTADLARLLAGELGEDAGRLLQTAPDPAAHAAARNRFTERVRTLAQGTAIHDVQLIDADGKQIFSRIEASPDQLDADPAAARSLRGEATQGFRAREKTWFSGYDVAPGDSVAAWVPLRAAEGKRVIGALAIDTHLDELAARVDTAERTLAVGLLLAFGVLYGLILYAIGRTRHMLVDHELARDHAQHELAIERDALEQKVHERTEALREANAVLQAEVSERQRNEDMIRELAFFDPLTQLPNRTMFRNELERALAEARRRTSRLAVMFIDLDNFKRINDTFGHNMGDELLRQAAMRIAGCVRTEDAVARGLDFQNRVARLGGDEFTLMLHDVGSSFNAAHVAQRLLEAFIAPFVLGIYKVQVSPSIGIAYYPLDGASADDLLRHADIAMYDAKQRGRNTFSFYSRTMSESAHAKLALENRLRAAIERKEFELFYQPKYNARNDQIVGFEALLRWNDPQVGLIQPGQFISLAEETGLIVPISDWVINETCRELRRWQDTGATPLPVSVNISSLHFQHARLAAVVNHAVAGAGISPHLLEIEVTESLFMEDMDNAVATLTRLRELGVRVAIDDFGTGYSSLTYLKRFPLDTLKIDRSFIADLPRGGGDAAICAAIVALARELGLDVVAEGVETRDQAEILVELGCEKMQGFLFGEPLRADAALQRILPPGVIAAPFGNPRSRA